MSDLGKEFLDAAKEVKTLKYQPSEQELLELYGLYKRVTEGVCYKEKPSIFNMKESAKWSAWCSKGKTSKRNAQEKYIALVKDLKSRENI